MGTVLRADSQQSITGLDSIVEQVLYAHLCAQTSSHQNLGQP